MFAMESNLLGRSSFRVRIVMFAFNSLYDKIKIDERFKVQCSIICYNYRLQYVFQKYIIDEKYIHMINGMDNVCETNDEL